MADDKTKPEPKIENPLLAFVKGATPTEASERLYEERFQGAEERRYKDAAMKQAAAAPATPNRSTSLSSHQLTANPDIPKAYVLLHYANRAGAKIDPGECCADVLITDWDNPDDLSLILICPRCLAGGVKHAQDCQITLQMRNRWWHLVPGKGDPSFIFDDGYGPKSYRSAGVVVESEIFTCSDCSWRARIVNNVIREE